MPKVAKYIVDSEASIEVASNHWLAPAPASNVVASNHPAAGLPWRLSYVPAVLSSNKSWSPPRPKAVSRSACHRSPKYGSLDKLPGVAYHKREATI